MHPFEQGSVFVLAAIFADVAECFAALFIKRVFIRISVCQKQCLFGNILHKPACPVDRIQRNDWSSHIGTHRIDDSKFAHFFKCPGPERHRNNQLPRLILGIAFIEQGVSEFCQRATPPNTTPNNLVLFLFRSYFLLKMLLIMVQASVLCRSYFQKTPLTVPLIVNFFSKKTPFTDAIAKNTPKRSQSYALTSREKSAVFYFS